MAMNRETLAGYLESRMGLASHEYDDDTGLFSMGVLDSFSMIDLVMFVESEAGIELDPTELSLDNLDSVNRILAFVKAKVA